MKNYLKHLKHNKKGFTLIEMIVVIAIIGVLAAILVPSLSGYVNSAKATKSSANARTFYTAAQAAVTSLETSSSPVGSGTSYNKGDNTDLDSKIQELLGASNYGKITSYSVTVDSNGAVSTITVTEDGGSAVTYPEETASPSPSNPA